MLKNWQLHSLIGLSFLLVLGFHLKLKKKINPDARRNWLTGFQASKHWIGKKAPLFELTLMDGRKFRLSDHLGKRVVALNFFTTWCGPCKIEMPVLNRFYEQYRDQDFVLIGIDILENKRLVQGFLDEVGVTFPVGIDTKGTFQFLYGISAYPTTVVIDAEGKIIMYERGAIMNVDVALKPLVEKELKALRKVPVGKEI